LVAGGKLSWRSIIQSAIATAYVNDSNGLRERLKTYGIELIAPHRYNRKRAPTQDSRPLHRYKRRWKVERLFAWLQNFRRILVRHGFRAENYLGFVTLGCILILLRRLL
jgi:IS4 transposase